MHKSKAKVGTIMKRTVTIGLLGAILAVAVGFISFNAISATPFFMAVADNSSDESFSMIGHVEYAVMDSNGQVIQYIQGDNLIVDRGRDCSAQRIFNASDTSACAFNGDGFNFIAIGNGTFAGTDATTQLDNEIQRNAGEVSITSNSGNTVVSVSTQTPFTFNHGGTMSITESGLFDDGTAGGDNMFSTRAVANIDVTAADTLAVTWTITLQ